MTLIKTENVSSRKIKTPRKLHKKLRRKSRLPVFASSDSSRPAIDNKKKFRKIHAFNLKTVICPAQYRGINILYFLRDFGHIILVHVS